MIKKTFKQFMEETTKRPKKKWLKPGDKVTTDIDKMHGTVMRVRKDLSMPLYTIKWDNGVTGCHGLTSLGIKKIC